MTSYYFANVAGFPRLTEKQLETIPRPHFELLTHVTTKTSQLGSFLGAGLVGPAVSAYKGNRDFESIQESSYDFGKKGLMIGLLAGPALWAAVAPRYDYDGAYDLVYRIRYNKQSWIVDRVSLFGTVVGLGAAHYIGEELGRGALFGYTGGFLAGTVLNFFW